LNRESNTMTDSLSEAELIRLTASLVTAHVSNNPVPPGDLPHLLQSVHSAFGAMGGALHIGEPAAPARSAFSVPAEERPEAEAEAEAETPVPIIAPEMSVHPGFLICLDCGREMRLLKRHLAITHHMTPAQYRAKWGLPADYPMIAANSRAAYSAHATRTENFKKARAALRTKRAKLDAAPPPPLGPAVDPAASITNQHLLCLECGESHVLLTTHLAKKHNLTPDAYREKWGLPADYPMIADAWRMKMRAHAHRRGLGTRIGAGSREGLRAAPVAGKAQTG